MVIFNDFPDYDFPVVRQVVFVKYVYLEDLKRFVDVDDDIWLHNSLHVTIFFTASFIISDEVLKERQ